MKLFTPLKLNGLELKNRIMMAPMCMYSSDNGGNVQNFHLAHYMSRAMGGAGLIMMEATAIEPRGRISSKDLGIWEDGQIQGLRTIIKECHAFGAKMGIQLAHAGRKCLAQDETPVAPSSIAFSNDYKVPIELTKADIDNIVKSFGKAAKRADEAGFDIIEIHGAHGYLIHEFLSPLTNKRSDEYGGSIENRVRILTEVIDSVKEYWPKSKPIFLRVSADDYSQGGIDIEEMIKILALVKDRGIDLVDVSSGGLVTADINIYPGYQIHLSQALKSQLGILTGAVGLITTAELAESTLSNNHADLIILGRELLRNPNWPLMAAKELRTDITWPTQYERAKK